MPKEKFTPTLLAEDLEAWRGWLEGHCRTEPAIHLIIYHKDTKVPSVHWHEAIEHALCYGWVDSVANKRDADSCYLRFSPRNPRSGWGRKNVERAKRMMAAGFMRQPGLDLIEAARAIGKWKDEDGSE
jgi:uncharacterized protein YdeI (YjbR/CyaY-like superfamily)